MKNERFQEFMEFVNKSIEYDGWSQSEGFKGYLGKLHEEIDELEESFEKKDNKNLKNELGDLLWIWAHLCIFAEKQKLFSIDDVIGHNIKKMSKRKPYIAEGRKVSREEALKLWHAAKEDEKMKK